jgi:hypothetical protein
MTKYFLILSLLFFTFYVGCGKSASDARSEDDFRNSIQASAEMTEVDAKLDALELETRALSENYEKLQATVLQHTTLDSDAGPKANQLIIYINDNSVLIVNDAAMSRNDFANYADKNLPALCTPTPKISIHRKADYDTAAWALEALYSRGCTNVDIE